MCRIRRRLRLLLSRARKRLAALDATTAWRRRAFAAGSVAVAASLGSRLAALGHAPAWDVAAALVFAAAGGTTRRAPETPSAESGR